MKIFDLPKHIEKLSNRKKWGWKYDGCSAVCVRNMEARRRIKEA
jgi:hypothetical protein